MAKIRPSERSPEILERARERMETPLVGQGWAMTGPGWAATFSILFVRPAIWSIFQFVDERWKRKGERSAQDTSGVLPLRSVCFPHGADGRGEGCGERMLWREPLCLFRAVVVWGVQSRERGYGRQKDMLFRRHAGNDLVTED